MKTLIITGEDVKKTLTPALANRIVEKAFKAYGTGEADMPPKSYLSFKEGDLRTMQAYIHGQGMDIAGVKSVNVHPKNRRFGLPSVMGIIVLTEPKKGRAIRSLALILGEDDEMVLQLKGVVIGPLPESADDFDKKKWFQ